MTFGFLTTLNALTLLFATCAYLKYRAYMLELLAVHAFSQPRESARTDEAEEIMPARAFKC